MYVTLFVPSYGGSISTTTFTSVLKLTELCRRKGINLGVSTHGIPDVVETRNIALTLWYDTVPQSSHLLMIDSDMGFEPELILDMLMFDHPVVGALYPKKVYPIQWVANRLNDTEMAPQKSGFMQVGGVGTGIFLIKREVVTKMLEKYPALSDERISQYVAANFFKANQATRVIRAFDKLDVKDGILSEDLSFCRRWTDMGGEVWASIDHIITHVGPHEFRMGYSTYVQQRAAQEPVKPQYSVAAE